MCGPGLMIAHMLTGIGMLPACLSALSGKEVQARAQLGQISPACCLARLSAFYSCSRRVWLAVSSMCLKARQEHCSPCHMQGWTLRRVCLHASLSDVGAAQHRVGVCCMHYGASPA